MTESTAPSNTSASTSTSCCPKCGANLTLQSHESIQVLACQAGCGVFINADALRSAMHDRTDDRTIPEEEAALDAAHPVNLQDVRVSEGMIKCPTCQARMEKRNYAYESGIIIDACDRHGFWLDNTELERIEAWFEGNEHAAVNDAKEWTPKLTQIAEDAEERANIESANVHWGPIAWVMRKIPGSWA